MNTKIMKFSKFGAPLVSKNVAMNQIARAIELQKKGIVKF